MDYTYVYIYTYVPCEIKGFYKVDDDIMQVTKLARQNSKSQDTVVPQLQLPACMMWAVTSFGYVLEKGDIFLTPEER